MIINPKTKQPVLKNKGISKPALETLQEGLLFAYQSGADAETIRVLMEEVIMEKRRMKSIPHYQI